MPIVRPRLNDYHDLAFRQEDVDFAIPFLDEDIPLYVDPFLLWRSPSMQDNSLHLSITNSINGIAKEFLVGNTESAISKIVRASECNPVGLGNSRTRKGKRIGKKKAEEILSVYQKIPELRSNGFVHFEEIQLLVDSFSKDRVSDIACNFMQSFLIDYTIDQCETLRIPMKQVVLPDYFDNRLGTFEEKKEWLPINPETKDPIMFIPKRWLRKVPWINENDYTKSFFFPKQDPDHPEAWDKIKILNFNRENFSYVRSYVEQKERMQGDCKNDPLFNPIPIGSAKRKLSTLLKLPSGKTDNADRKYEDLICQLFASLLYPQLDFAKEQSRTDSGVLIRDIIFYNNRSFDFLQDIHDDYGSRQIVMELKNVKELQREHINQLNRYMNDQFGKFGILVTRNRPSKKIIKNVIDLWAGQRKCILILDDSDVSLMCEVFASKQRLPIEVIKKKYIEFTQILPS